MNYLIMTVIVLLGGFSVYPKSINTEELRPKLGPQAVRLFKDHRYIQAHKAPDFWALIPYYLPQQDGKSCSVASVAMLLNAARANQNLTASDELVTQKSLLDKLKNASWTDAVGASGHGVSLDHLGQLIRESFIKYGFKKAKVEVVHLESASRASLDKLSKILTENEKSSDNFLIINFLQSIYTGDPEGAVGHIAPVGAYNQAAKQVLVLDPDRQYYEPYWVSVETLFAGMGTTDKTSNKNRGYVWVQVGASSRD